MKINIFVPPKFTKQTLDIDKLNHDTNKIWNYASCGRASLYHILKPLDIKKILVPAYICSTILESLKKLQINPIFYDLEIEDLNASLESIDSLSKKYSIKTLLIASMYGNPADLSKIENYCKKNNIFLIDDAAQSFGSKLNDKYVGTFGDAGFFSFSPGKPTAGHMGSFFWSNENYVIKRNNHCLSHYVRWIYFYITRYKSYESNSFIKKICTLLYIFTDKYFDLYNDNICKFEKNILGGILVEKFSFRKKYHDIFIEKFSNNNCFKIIKSIRGVPNNHKIVLCFNQRDVAKKFIEYMKDNEIFVLNGYTLLSTNFDDLPNAKSIDKKIVELPIEDSLKKMNYIFSKIEEFYAS